MEAVQQKAELRQAVLRRLKAATSAQRAADSTALRALLFPVLAALEAEKGRPLTIALYAPLPHEVDLMPLLREHPQHRYAFPRCHPQRQLSFHLVSDPASELTPGAMGILTPSTTQPAVTPEAIDLLLVPGVAFTEDGARLGYGGGYYDTLLPACRNARVLALAFAEQMQPRLPCEPHDHRLPQVLHL